MNKILKLGVLSAVVLPLVLGSPWALAKGGGGRGAGHGGGSSHGGGIGRNSGAGQTGMPAGFSHGEKKGWKGESTPPGWSHGEKKGWQGAKLPPGLAKKQPEQQPEPETGTTPPAGNE